MAKYSKKASEKVEEVMKERKKGTLKSGSGKKVTSRKQAIAIGLSEAGKEGAKVPEKKSRSKTAKKSGTRKKAASHKNSRKPAAGKKSAAKK